MLHKYGSHVLDTEIRVVLKIQCRVDNLDKLQVIQNNVNFIREIEKNVQKILMMRMRFCKPLNIHNQLVKYGSFKNANFIICDHYNTIIIRIQLHA